MSFDARFRSLFSRSARVWLLAVCLGLLVTGGPAFGVAGNGTPAVPVPGGSTPPSPNDRWNASSSIKPAAILEDFTWFVGLADPRNGNTRQFYALDIENGILFAATGQGLEIIDVRNGPNTSAASYIYGYHVGGSFPGWTFPGDEDWFIKYVDAPAGNSGVVALGMEGQGFSIVRTTNPAAPVVAYHGKVSTRLVYSVRAAGTDWAYALGDSGQVYRFNLTAGAGLNGCLETPPAIVCPNVYKGVVASLGSPWSALHGAGNFLATGKWTAGGQVKIWSLADPAAPAAVLQINAQAVGLAMWQSGSSYYLARIDAAKKLTIHNVSCLVSGSCSSAPEIWSTTLASPTPLANLTVSQDGAKTYLYVGGSDLGSCAVQREYIFDATSPTAPVELTPKIHAAGYWGWYYHDCATGFNLVGPRIAKVYNHHLYRAANNLLDAHSIGSQDSPPTANFTWSPSEIYPGTTVTFSDQSSGSPTQWTWTFEDGTPSVSSAQNPQIDFPASIAPGPKTVTLEAVNSFGADSHNAVLTVSDPSPQLTGVNVSPVAPIPVVCQPVTMTAVNPSGKPPLQYQWKVKNSTGAEVFSQTNANQSQQWDTASASAGTYTAELTLSGTGTPVTRTKAFTLGALPSLPPGDQFTPTIDPFSAGTVTFHVVASGATAWNWDFDGDGIFNESDWTDDPVNGPNPTHSYSTTGTRQVRVKVRNCQNLIGVISAPVSVDITQITPLKALFAANTLCSGGVCFVTAGQAVPFVDLSTGADRWDYDWNGDGSFEDADNTAPRLSHTFATTGTFTPRLRVRRGESEEKTYILDTQIDVSPAAPGSITVGGPSSGQTSTSITFTASGSGSCSPSANGWSWSLAGGSATGSVTGSSVTVTWASAGTKVISASNSACSGVSGSKSVTITGGGNNGPSITIGGPSSGQTNASLTFTASGSGGCAPNPNGWSWSLSGGTATGGVTDGSVTVSWESAGTKVISASNSACSGVSGSKSVTITAGSNNATLKADFTVSPAAPVAGQAVSFNGGISQGSPDGYTWAFNDGTALGTGAQVSHTFAQPGSYRVELSVSKVSTQCAPAPFCENTLVKTVVVGSGAPPLVAAFNSDICNNPLSLCITDSGKSVTFTDSSTGNIVSRMWDFGDGETATGTTVTHAYKRAGTYQLTLTVSDGTKSNVFARTILVNGVLTEDMLLPWIGKAADGPLVQTSDLYLHNPSTESIDVTLEFRQRGNVGTVPPVQRTIAPNATLFASDVVKSLFGIDNMTGFLAVKIDRGSTQPVLMSFNTTFRSGGEFGQTIPGFLQSNTGAAATTGNNQVQHLVGLNDNEERLAYFGFSNPADSPVTYTLRFFDNLGNAIGTSETLTLGRLGAKQFQSKEIRSRFGLTDKDDYRVVVETPRSAQLFPYGANVRIGSADPSFLTVGTGAARTYLLGALSTPGMNNSIWRSDLVLANTGSQVVIADISFTNVGATSQPTDVIHETLQPGETRRLADVIGAKWNIRNGVGVLTIDSDAPEGQLPVVQGESYENTNPAKRYGQTLPGLTDAQAAGPGQGQYLVGLRQDAKYRTTCWLFNPGTTTGQYDVIFRNLEGQEIGRLANVGLGAGKLRQLNQVQFPAGLTGGFTVQILVKQGKGLAAAQVVNNVTNDPAYVQGETR